MNIIIHDQIEEKIKGIIKNNSEETILISNTKKINHCICCYACWIKIPGLCILNDGYNNMGKLLSKCKQLIIVSQCFYGSYSPFVKNVLDRSVCPSMLPYFKTKNGKTYHPRRYENYITLSVHFYGNISENEKKTAEKLVKSSGRIIFNNASVNFYHSFEEINGV